MGTPHARIFLLLLFAGEPKGEGFYLGKIEPLLREADACGGCMRTDKVSTLQGVGVPIASGT
jgi:hypothetical protein